jgi:hypothetical protein
MATVPESRNAAIARAGNRAEDFLVTQQSVHQALTTYFGRGPIRSIEKITGKKKSDIRVNFQDGTHVNIQNKDGDGDGRGWSFDRRNVTDHTTNPALHTLLTNVCIRHEGERPEITDEWLVAVLDSALCGEDPAYMPDYITHTKSNKTTGVIEELYICPIDTIITTLYDEFYSSMVAKQTCVHLSPSIYMQRKGGGLADANPDQIQMKWRLTPNVAKVFTRLL